MSCEKVGAALLLMLWNAALFEGSLAWLHCLLLFHCLERVILGDRFAIILVNFKRGV